MTHRPDLLQTDLPEGLKPSSNGWTGYSSLRHGLVVGESEGKAATQLHDRLRRCPRALKQSTPQLTFPHQLPTRMELPFGAYPEPLTSHLLHTAHTLAAQDLLLDELVVLQPG